MTTTPQAEANGVNVSDPAATPPKTTQGWFDRVPPRVQRLAEDLQNRRADVAKSVSGLFERIPAPSAALGGLRVKVEDARRKAEERTQSIAASALSQFQQARVVRGLEVAASERLDVLAEDLHQVAKWLRAAARTPPPSGGSPDAANPVAPSAPDA